MKETYQAFFADFIYYNSKIHKDSYLLISNDKIVGITKDKTTLTNYHITRYKNSAIFPAFINTHTHVGMSLFRGFADDLPLMEWLKDYIWKIEKRYISADFVYLATLLSSIELIRSGTSMINDMYFYPESISKAISEAKLRAIIGFGALISVDKALENVETFKSTDMIKPALCPHALYTVGKDSIKRMIEFADPRGILIHTHLAETDAEIEIVKEKYNTTPALLMNDIGGFDTFSIFAHAVHLTDEEIKIMGEKKVNISHCVESNLKLASGIAPIMRLQSAGANITIGTDGVASNNDQMMINEISTVAKLHKAISKDATTLSADTVLKMSTENAAKALRADNLGKLAKGNQADFFVISFDSVNMTPVYNPISHLLYSATSNDITDLVVAGKMIMKNRKILTIDEEAIKQEARKVAKKIKI